MKSSKKTKSLAEKIADKLFTIGGTKKQAYRLALVDMTAKEICGWSKEPATDAIQGVIDQVINGK